MTSERDDGRFDFARQRLGTISATFLQKTGVVPVANRSNALFMLDTRNGDQYVVKRGIHSTDLVAEAVGWLLSRELSVRTPEAAFVTGERAGWASRLVDAAMNWAPDDAGLCDPVDVARIFVLDALVGNTDRHNDNVLVFDVGGDAPLWVYSIDLGNSRIGHPEGFAELGLDVADDPQFLDGVDRTGIEHHAAGILAQAEQLAKDRGRITAIAYQAGLATHLISPDEQELLSAALADRLQNAEKLLSAHLDVTVSKGSP